ncbi:MAG: polysaccharide deacetylase family protein [Anaerolineae bacterium]|nr:polysaccharide deacetylase family protein [Anaerolineae bacterium]
MTIKLAHAVPLLLIAVLTGCGPGVPLSAAEVPTAVRATEEGLTGTPLIMPTMTPTLVVPTATAAPTETPLPTPTASPEPTATPAATDTPVATSEPTATPEPTATYPPPPLAVNVPVLMYHYISELPADADIYRRDLTVTPDRFEAQLQYLRDQGYQSITLTDVYETLALGKPLPARPIVLTFDDGYIDAYTHAFPLLQTYGFIGEFFVLATPAHFEAPAYMTWDEMRVMADAGMSIQAHGRDHYDLTNRDYDFLVYQILGAREAVEAHTGRPASFFCYPSGRHDASVEAVVESAGYLGAVTTAWGTEMRLDNRTTWPRIRIKGAWGIAEFSSVLSSLER